MHSNLLKWVLVLTRAVFLCALLVVLYLAVAHPMPGGQAGVLSVHDKLVHGFVYAALTTLGLLGRLGKPTVLLVLVSHGALVEVLQALVPERSADVIDLLADCAGIFVALLVSHVGMRVLGPLQQTG